MSSGGAGPANLGVQRDPIRLSVVTELENASVAGRARAVTALSTLARQLREQPQGRISGAELVVAHDPQGGCAPATIVAEAGIEGAVDDVRFVAEPGGDYFALKNAGAEWARGDLLLFLDSDVIPEPGWLEALLDAASDPGVDVVGSHCFVEGEDLVSRAYALFGIFPLESEPPPDADRAGLWLNSLAVRTPVARRHPFPDLPLYRRTAYLWGEQLRAKGLTLRTRRDARVAHPAPRGAAALMRREAAAGHDQYASRRNPGGGTRPGALVMALGASGWRAVRRTGRTVWKGPSAGLGPLETLAAAGLCAAAHAARIAGCLASFARDGRLPPSDRGWLSPRTAGPGR